MWKCLDNKAAGLADKATASEHKTGLLNYFAHKQLAYTKLMTAITRRIIRVTTHARSCRQATEEERAKSDACRYVITPAVPRFACIADSLTLRLVDPPPICGGSQQQHSLRLRLFWTTLYVCPISYPNNEHGITWLQLFAVYILNGGYNDAAAAVGRLSARLKLAPLFQKSLEILRRSLPM